MTDPDRPRPADTGGSTPDDAPPAWRDAWRTWLPVIALVAVVAGIAAAVALFPSGSATAWDQSRAEMRDDERQNAVNEPPIPLSQRVRCDVCPDVCGYVDLHMVPLDELFRDYPRAVAVVYELHRKPGTPTAWAWRLLRRVSCLAASRRDVCDRLLQYLQDPTPIVQVATADLAFEHQLIETHRGYEVLRRHADPNLHRATNTGYFAFGVLQKWRILHRNPGWRPPQPEPPPCGAASVRDPAALSD